MLITNLGKPWSRENLQTVVNRMEEGDTVAFEGQSIILIRPPAPPPHEEYREKVRSELVAHPTWRRGQAFMNVLWEMRPDLYKKVIDGGFNPFHEIDDTARGRFIIGHFLQFIQKEW